MSQNQLCLAKVQKLPRNILSLRKVARYNCKMMSFETLSITFPFSSVALVEINRPKQLNAMNNKFWIECVQCFKNLDSDTNVRVIVLAGRGKHFSAGLDLTDAAAAFMNTPLDVQDAARRAFQLRDLIFSMQEAFNVIERCKKPVIAAVKGACIGGGVDMIASCDVRYAEASSFFSVKEVDIGLAADLGSLQRVSKVIGNESWLREAAFTGRRYSAEEVLKIGLVSKVVPEDVVGDALKLAVEISGKSPVAVAGSKIVLNHARDHSIREGLEFIATWNMAMLQTNDIPQAVQATLQKSNAIFSKL